MKKLVVFNFFNILHKFPYMLLLTKVEKKVDFKSFL